MRLQPGRETAQDSPLSPVQLSTIASTRAELKVMDLYKVTDPNLRFPAVFCENLRFSAKIPERDALGVSIRLNKLSLPIMPNLTRDNTHFLLKLALEQATDGTVRMTTGGSGQYPQDLGWPNVGLSTSHPGV